LIGASEADIGKISGRYLWVMQAQISAGYLPGDHHRAPGYLRVMQAQIPAGYLSGIFAMGSPLL